MSDGELHAVVGRWSDVVAAAPPFVKPLLDQAHAEHRRLANRYDRQVAERGKDREPGRRLQELGLSVQKAAEQVETYLRSTPSGAVGTTTPPICARRPKTPEPSWHAGSPTSSLPSWPTSERR